MALQIKEPATIRLIEDLSRRTGESAETVLQVALRERLARLRTPEEEAARRARVYEIVQDLQARSKEHPEAVVDPGEFLYDDAGLPK